MRQILTFLAMMIIAVSCVDSTAPYVEGKKEVESFLDRYQELLRRAKFDSVALLYVDTGFVSIGNGGMAVENIDSIKARYARFPKVKNDFRWENPRIEMLSSRAALVNSIFYWHDHDSPDTTKTTYTGVFLKINKDWKIINEHESVDVETLAALIRKSENK